MATYADKQTDKELSQLESRLKGAYQSAYNGLQTSVNEFFNNFQIQDERMKKELEDGEIDEDEYKKWRIAQFNRGDRWKTLRDQMADRMTNTNKVAEAYINDKTPEIYSLNHNYSAFEIEKDSGVSFTLVDEQTIKNLAEGNNQVEFRTVKINPDRDYQWNKDRIDHELMSGILQGKSANGIAGMFLNVMQNNLSSAIRNARTAITSAQNSGRQRAYKEAEDMGIEIQKEWIATIDDRTRESHAELDGVRVGNDEKFPNGLMYPADPEGEPAEVYNCRCTMRAIIPKYNGAKRKTEIEGHQGEHDVQTYMDWLNGKVAEQQALPQHEQAHNINDEILKAPIKSNDAEYTQLVDTLNNAGVQYKGVKMHDVQPSQGQIVNNLCGGDRTQGSCASVGMAYIGQVNGMDVLDFRDGNSRDMFSRVINLNNIARMDGVVTLRAQGASSLTVGNRLLKQCEVGKEYYLCVGRHASIVRAIDGEKVNKRTGKTENAVQYQYLELQSAYDSGWHYFDGNARNTLSHRFGCSSASDGSSYWDFMINITDSNFKTDEFRSLMGYINTNEDEQRKGKNGSIK